MPKLLRLLLSVFAVLSLGVALAACGDDDDADTDDTSTTEAADEATDEGEETAATLCGRNATEVFPGEGEPAEDAEAVTVTATEDDAGGSTVYSFSDNVTTDLAEVGEYAITFQNDGAEMHEMVVIRLNDDETRSVQELLEAQEDPSTFSTDVAFGSACPGQSSGEIAASFESAGRYVMGCFFPVGSEPGLTEEELGAIQGPPHAAQGMITEIVVS